jgi:hypothetical protein
MDPLALRVAARFAGDVVELRPRPGAPKLQIGARHYVLSTDSGPLMGDIAEALAPAEGGGARLIAPPEHANKWRYFWAYNTDEQVVAMWRASDGDEKLYDSAKHQGPQIIRLEKKGQLNRVTAEEFKQIDSFMRKRQHESIEDLKRIIEENKGEADKHLDALARSYFNAHVVPHIEKALSDVKSGATPFGFKPYDPKGAHVSVARQASVFVIGQIMKREMSVAKLETFLRQHHFDLEAVDPQALEWVIADIADEAYETYLPPR